MDLTTILNRIQFGTAISYHFIFPPTTIGLSLVILITETLYYFKKEPLYKHSGNLLIEVLAIIYVIGVATGSVMEFLFGTNWTGFAIRGGDVVGPPAAIEAITSFALEGAFLAILVFGRNKVSGTIYWVAAILVFFGAHFSGWWIISANSWMQTPAGYDVQGDTFVVKNFIEAMFNHSTWVRYGHTINASWLTGLLLWLGISAWYKLKNKHEEFSKLCFSIALPLLFIFALSQIVLGHLSAVTVDRYQPEKNAAIEGIFETQKFAPLYLFGIPDRQANKILLPVAIPGMLSFLTGLSFDREIKGFNSFPPENRPAIEVVFQTFHLMVLFGGALLLTGLVGSILLFRKKLARQKWFLWLLVCIVPLPYINNELGWVTAEIGRQPWVIYGLLRTADGSNTTVPFAQVLITLIALFVIYIIISFFAFFFLKRTISKGPVSEEAFGYGG